MTELFSYEPETQENSVKITSRKLKIQEKLKTKIFLKKEKANQVLTELPKQNESHFIISNGNFDYFTLIPIIIELLKSNIDEFYFSTWTMNFQNVKLLLTLYDSGKIKKISALTGLYFKQREANVYNELYEGLKKRNQKIFSNENHSKITLMKTPKANITIDGSANFTANPRIEQFTIHNNVELYEFNKNWMDCIIV